MISHFRVAGSAPTRDEVIDKLTEIFNKVVELSPDQPAGEWECTSDVVEKSENGYRGRMTFQFHPERETVLNER